MLLSHAVLLVRPGRLSPGIASLLPIAFLPAATAQHYPDVIRGQRAEPFPCPHTLPLRAYFPSGGRDRIPLVAVPAPLAVLFDDRGLRYHLFLPVEGDEPAPIPHKPLLE